jgi:hypothetical protein
MRISALSSTLALATLVTFAGPAHADRKAPRVATASGPARDELRVPTLTTGDLSLTGPARTAQKEPFLAAADITAQVAPHASEIGRCYLDGIGAARRPGHLDLTFVITRGGNVLSLAAAAPGVPAKVVQQIARCIHKTVEGLQFPARRNDTTAVVPYFFQRTVAPSADTQLQGY